MTMCMKDGARLRTSRRQVKFTVFSATTASGGLILRNGAKPQGVEFPSRVNDLPFLHP